MALYTGECSDDLPEHLCTPCPTVTNREFGRVRTSGFIFGDYYPTLMANPTLKAVWDAGILAGKIIVVPETAGAYDPGTPKELKGYGNRPKSYGPRTMKLDFSDPNLVDNYAHYNALSGQTELYPFFVTSSQLRIFDAVGTITASDPVADDIESEVTWNVSVEVVSATLPPYFPITNLVNTVFKCSYLNTLTNGLRFTTQPLTQTPASGTDVTFTTVAAGGSGTKTYQWQISTDGGTTWTNITGATLATYTINDATSANNAKYRNRVTDTTGTINSTVATLTVAAPTSYDTTLTFTSSTSANAAGVAGEVLASDADLKFEFNLVTPRTGTPANMNINLSSTLVMVVTFPTDYAGAAFKFTDAAGVVHTGVFTNGTVNF